MKVPAFVHLFSKNKIERVWTKESFKQCPLVCNILINNNFKTNKLYSCKFRMKIIKYIL